MSTPRDTGTPDAFAVAAHARRLELARRSFLVALPLEVLTIVAAVVILLLTGAHWSWVLLGATIAMTMISFTLLLPDKDAERPRPATSLEVAVVIGVEIADWRNASSDDQHRVRVIARPLGSATAELVHGYHQFHKGDPWPTVPGTLIGIRRFPTMKHLVWLEDHPDPGDLLRVREGIRGGSGLEDATVTSLSITGTGDGDWWPTEVHVRTTDGAFLVSSCARLPEELGPLGPGTAVRILRERGDSPKHASRCAILSLGESGVG